MSENWLNSTTSKRSIPLRYLKLAFRLKLPSNRLALAAAAAHQFANFSTFLRVVKNSNLPDCKGVQSHDISISYQLSWINANEKACNSNANWYQGSLLESQQTASSSKADEIRRDETRRVALR